MTIYKFQQRVEFLNIFLLLVKAHIGKKIDCVNPIAAQLYKEVQKQGVDGKLAVIASAEIFISRLKQVGIQVVIDFGVGILSNMNGLA